MVSATAKVEDFSMEQTIVTLDELDNYLESENYESTLEDEEARIIAKHRFLVSKGLSHIKIREIEKWLKTFNGKLSHRFISLFILQSITYRNYEMMESAFSRKISKDIKNIYEEISPYRSDSLEEWLRLIRYSKNIISAEFANIHFYCIDKRTSSVTQSSNAILRRLSSKVINHLRILQNIDEVKESIKTNNMVVFIDDFLGSGTQAAKFFNDHKIFESNDADQVPLIYMPLMATNIGIDNLESEFPNLRVLPSEIIEEDSKLSKHHSLHNFLQIFDLDVTKIDIEKLFIEMQFSYSFIRMKAWLGWTDAMLSIVFEWGCPNLTVPLIYHDNNKPTTENPDGHNVMYPLAARRV